MRALIAAATAKKEKKGRRCESIFKKPPAGAKRAAAAASPFGGFASDDDGDDETHGTGESAHSGNLAAQSKDVFVMSLRQSLQQSSTIGALPELAQIGAKQQSPKSPWADS